MTRSVTGVKRSLFPFSFKKKEDPKDPSPSIPPKEAASPVAEKKDTQSSGKMKWFSLGAKILIVLITAGIFGVAIPMQFQDLANVTQAFVRSTNFTIESNSLDIDNVKKAPELKKDATGKTNIMLVGVDTRYVLTRGGGTLRNTDSLMLATYDHKTNRIGLISFPRDIIANFPNTPSFMKINAIYATGESRSKGSGLESIKQTLENFSGLKIQYYAMVDLKGFTTVIDLLGGIDVHVDRSFTDYLYPTDNYRWRTVSFTQGWAHMNGDTALAFSRSRHSQQAGEGSDFARARRQQKVIQGVIDQALKQETLQNPKKIFEILNAVASSIQVNQLTPEDVEAALAIAKDKGKPEIFNVVMDPNVANKTLLQVGGYGTGYTVTTKGGVKNIGPSRQYLQDFSTEPTIVNDITIPVYNGKSGSFTSKYRSLTGRFFYLKMYNAGNTEEYQGDTVFNHGGKQYESLAKFVAGTMGMNYVEVVDESIKAPRPNGVPVVIVIGK
jgi:LCP family protein required for cell wall assembly